MDGESREDGMKGKSQQLRLIIGVIMVKLCNPNSYLLNEYTFSSFVRWNGSLFTPEIWKKPVLTLTDSIWICFDCIDE